MILNKEADRTLKTCDHIFDTHPSFQVYQESKNVHEKVNVEGECEMVVSAIE